MPRHARRACSSPRAPARHPRSPGRSSSRHCKRACPSTACRSPSSRATTPRAAARWSRPSWRVPESPFPTSRDGMSGAAFAASLCPDWARAGRLPAICRSRHCSVSVSVSPKPMPARGWSYRSCISAYGCSPCRFASACSGRSRRRRGRSYGSPTGCAPSEPTVAGCASIWRAHPEGAAGRWWPRAAMVLSCPPRLRRRWSASWRGES